MPFGIKVSDGFDRLKGVWWIASEKGPADAAYLDEWEQMLADERIFEMTEHLKSGEVRPVLRSDAPDAVPQEMDWLDVLVREARPSLRNLGEWVDGPFRADAESAEDLLAWVKENEIPPEAMVTDRIFVP
jgi:hypothetical protein